MLLTWASKGQMIALGATDHTVSIGALGQHCQCLYKALFDESPSATLRAPTGRLAPSATLKRVHAQSWPTVHEGQQQAYWAIPPK